MPREDEFDIELEFQDDDDDDYVDGEDEDAPEYGDADVLDAEEMDDDDEVEGLRDESVRTLAQLLGGDDEDDEQPVATMNTGSGTVGLTMRDLLRFQILIARTQGGSTTFRRTRGAAAEGPPLEFPEITEPQEKGVELLMSGEFGKVSCKADRLSTEAHLSRVLRDRGTRSRPMSKEDLTSHVVPNSNGATVAQYHACAYAGQFSTDSSFYYTCCQNWKLHIYDMTVAPKLWEPKTRRNTSTHETTMTVIKDITAVEGGWTITDSHLSPDNQRMIYSTMTSTVYMTNTLDSSPEQTPLEFADRQSYGYGYGDRIWSCRFSADGNEVVAGGSGNIFVYDLLANRRTVKISAHEDDVNSCCWADTASGNVLISASDDTFLKVWDRRSLGASRKPAGVLVGHTEGITNVSAKGDGRYVISNGKDQALRLWDLRNMCSSADFDGFRYPSYGDPNFDYRYGEPPRIRRAAHPKDCSVMTYRGHQVLQTLIRCYFSPAETTGGRYIYSGSSDGRIHVWSLDGRVVQVLDRSRSLPMAYDPSEPEPPALKRQEREDVCVRDVSWHSQEPILMSVGWKNRRSGSNVVRHEWKGLTKLGNHVEDWVDKESAEYAERKPPTTRSAGGRIPGAYVDSDMAEEDDDWTDEDDL